MARYSSESDSDHNSRYRRRRSRRSRSSSSDSTDSSSHRRRSSKHLKTKRRYRSRSRSRERDRDRNQKAYKRSRNSSSKGRERYRYRSRSRSSERSKRKARSTSREKSGSRSSSSQSNAKAATFEKSKTILIKDDFPIEPRFKEGVLDEINSEGFTPKQFSSSNTKEKKFKNIVIDISADTIQVPTVADIPCGSESIFHSSIMIDQEVRFDKWVKKLYTLRQKAIADLMHSSIT